MKKIWLMLIFIGLFSGSVFALDQGQFQITTGLNFHDLDWNYSDSDKEDIKEKQNIYTIPFMVEFGILKGFDVRAIAVVTFIDVESESFKGFNQPALGLKFMPGMIGGSVDVWLPLISNDIEDTVNKSTRFDFRFYFEPVLGPVKLDCLFGYYLDISDKDTSAHLITLSARPQYTLTGIGLTLALGVQLDYYFHPHSDSSDTDGYLVTLEPGLEYKIGSMVKLGLAFNVALFGNDYGAFGGESFSNNLLSYYSGYGLKTFVSVLF